MEAIEIRISEAALSRLREAAVQEGVNPAETYLRIAVVPGGCSGLTYDLGWDTTVGPNDFVQEVGAFRVVIDERSYLYIEGSTLDFSGGLEGKGFHFDNPQAIRTCACGESFGL